MRILKIPIGKKGTKKIVSKVTVPMITEAIKISKWFYSAIRQNALYMDLKGTFDQIIGGGINEALEDKVP